MKKVFSLLLVVLVLSSLTLTAYAHEVPDLDKLCSITMKVAYNQEPVDGGTLTVIKVGNVGENDGNYFFVRLDNGEEIEDIQSADAVTSLLEYYNANKESVDAKTVNIENGTAKVTDLRAGLYLVIQETASPGYTELSPFLVSLPYIYNGEDTEDAKKGEYVYDVTAAVKSELERIPETTEPPPPSGGDLPQTGQLNWPVPVLAVGGLVLIVVGVLLRKKRGNYEK